MSIYDDFVKSQSAECETVMLDPEDRLFILYTSGTTGKPKGIEHVHGGYAVCSGSDRRLGTGCP